MTDSKSQPPLRNSNTISSSSLDPPPRYSEDIERGVTETSPLYPGRLPFFSFLTRSFHYFVLQQIPLRTQFQGKVQSESRIAPYWAQQSPNAR